MQYRCRRLCRQSGHRTRCRRSAARRQPCRSDGPAGVRSAQDCRARRLRRKSWSSCHPWSDLWPGSQSPFCALAMAVDLDDGGIDHGIFHVGLIREGIEKPLENIGLAPVTEAPERRAPVAEIAGRSRHGLPVRTIHSTASMNRRLSLPLRPGSVGLPRQCGSIFAHWASVNTKRSIKSLIPSPNEDDSSQFQSTGVVI